MWQVFLIAGLDTKSGQLSDTSVWSALRFLALGYMEYGG